MLEPGYYEEFPPAADLRAFVACSWVKLVHHGGVERPIAIIPDGCADLLVYDDSPPFVVGPDAVTRWIALGEGLAIVGLRLRPGATRAVVGCGADELLGKSVDLAELGRDGARLERDLSAVSAPVASCQPGARFASVRGPRRSAPELARARIALLEGWVRARVARSRVLDLGAVRACRALAQSPRMNMDALAHELGWNARMLHRAFVATCGYGPKYLQRILRVQGVVRAAQRPGRRLSEVSLDLGFADQAHMTRDFRRITGMTPTSYLAEAEAGVGRWLDEAW